MLACHGGKVRYTPEQFFSTLFNKSPEGFKVLMVEKDQSKDHLEGGDRVDPRCKGSIWRKIHSSEGRCLYFHCGIDSKMYRKKRARKQDIDGVCFLWVDIDYVDDSKIEELLNFSNPPSAIVRTGNGFHAYWVLDKMYESGDQIENRNRWLAKELGGDSVCDVSRLLRVPGSKNTKREPHAEVEIVYCSDIVYALDCFPEIAAPKSAVDTSTIDDVELSDTFLEDLPSYLKEMITDPRSPGEDRSDRDWRLANKLAELGKDESTIYAVLTHPSWPIGEKGRDNQRYAKRTAAKAAEKNKGMAAIMSFIQNEVAETTKKKNFPQ